MQKSGLFRYTGRSDRSIEWKENINNRQQEWRTKERERERESFQKEPRSA